MFGSAQAQSILANMASESEAPCTRKRRRVCQKDDGPTTLVLPFTSQDAVVDQAERAANTISSVEDSSGKVKAPLQDAPKSSREAWDNEDKNLFFDALKACGKDFDAISRFMVQKSRNRCRKNYDQVRSFYYNTWSKIGAHVNFDNLGDVQRDSRELFVLVNFGEWRKNPGLMKNFSTNLSIREKFTELVRKGHTTIKLPLRKKNNGKQPSLLKLRTPSCPALKKFCDALRLLHARHILGVDQPVPLVPAEICVELTPKAQKDKWWPLRMQQNPFLRAFFAAQYPVKQFIEFLQVKWSKEPHAVEITTQTESVKPAITLVFPDNAALCTVQLSVRDKTTAGFSLDSYARKVTGASKAAGSEPQSTLNADADQSATLCTEGASNASAGGHRLSSPVDTTTRVTGTRTSATLNPDMFADGITADTAGGLTVGQLFLMHSCAQPLRLHYRVTHEDETVLQTRSSAAWECFLHLLKTDLVETLHRKATHSVVVPSAPQSAAARGEHTTPARKGVCSTAVRKTSASTLPVKQSHTRNAEAPQAAVAGDASLVATNPAVVMQRESTAFMAQLGELESKSSRGSRAKRIVVRHAFVPDGQMVERVGNPELLVTCSSMTAPVQPQSRTSSTTAVSYDLRVGNTELVTPSNSVGHAPPSLYALPSGFSAVPYAPFSFPVPDASLDGLSIGLGSASNIGFPALLSGTSGASLMAVNDDVGVRSMNTVDFGHNHCLETPKKTF